MASKESKNIKDKRNLSILILAIIIILAAVVIVVYIYSLLAMNNSGAVSPGVLPISISCKAMPGYTCQANNHLSVLSNLDDMVVGVEQNTGATWYGANFILVRSGTASINGIPNIGGPAFSVWPSNTAFAATPFSSGENVILYLPVMGSINLSSHEPLTATIWAAYTITSNSPVHYVQVASLNITEN